MGLLQSPSAFVSRRSVIPPVLQGRSLPATPRLHPALPPNGASPPARMCAGRSRTSRPARPARLVTRRHWGPASAARSRARRRRRRFGMRASTWRNALPGFGREPRARAVCGPISSAGSVATTYHPPWIDGRRPDWGGPARARDGTLTHVSPAQRLEPAFRSGHPRSWVAGSVAHLLVSRVRGTTEPVVAGDRDRSRRAPSPCRSNEARLRCETCPRPGTS